MPASRKTDLPMIVSDEDVEKALHELNDTIVAIGQAKGRTVKAEAMLRHVKAVVMTFSGENAISGQERDAYASDTYKAAVVEFQSATIEYETLKAAREHSDRVISVWQTQCSNSRSMRV